LTLPEARVAAAVDELLAVTEVEPRR
jgi:hypothetical protein